MTTISKIPFNTPRQIASSLLSMIVAAIFLFAAYYLTAPLHRIIGVGVVETIETLDGKTAIGVIVVTILVLLITISTISISIGLAYLTAKMISTDESYNTLLTPIIVAGMITVVLTIIHGLVTIHTSVPTPQQSWIEPDTITHTSILFTASIFTTFLATKHKYGKRISFLRLYGSKFKNLKRLLPSSKKEDSTPSQSKQRTKQGHNRNNQSHKSTSIEQQSTDLEYDWAHTTGVSFDDVGGMYDLKRNLYLEVIKPFEEVERARNLGIRPPNILFHGPPGTGKTFMAEALAGELQLPFVKLSGSDITTKWINESSTKINRLFTEAKAVANSEGGAIIFIDELDSILKDRSANSESHNEDTKVVNELLNHLEDSNTYGVIFIGATNRPDALDQAGTRSGRIDKKVEIGKPDIEARKEILAKLLEPRNHTISIDHIHDIAEKTDGFVASDLKLLIQNAATNVFARDADDIITADDLETAMREMQQS